MYWPSSLWRTLVVVATASLAAAGPCDIYAAGKTPCVAAHSTTRSLYRAYDKALYQVRRSSDGKTKDIEPIQAGGVANAAAQDSFCAGTTCNIITIYDQSGHGNNLTPAPPGGHASGPGRNGFDLAAHAAAAPVTVHGRKTYGVYIMPGMGYRNDKTHGIATGDEPEGIYAVLDGTHYNDVCCFDYGNAETNAHNNGNGHMETIYFGNDTFSSFGSGSGPWILADMENGLFADSNGSGEDAQSPSIYHRFVTAIVKGQPGHWAIRGGDATSGPLSTLYSGPRPSASGYNPMSKEGAIVLGIGGDNSNGAEGTFYEGAMTRGFPSRRTEGKVQANIVAAKYAA